MAISPSQVSATIGYQLKPGNFSPATPNLPQRIMIIGEANNANQDFDETQAKEITSAAQAGAVYGFGSPIHQMMRILRPVTGGGVGTIPTLVFAQKEDAGASANTFEVGISGTATGNATHELIINGRNGVDGQFYTFNVAEGDQASEISQKISDAINSVAASPVSGSVSGSDAVGTTKWKGSTANELDVKVNTRDSDVGITYAVTVNTNGAGEPDLSEFQSNFGEEWTTIVLSGYGLANDTVNDLLEGINGFPFENNPTQRFAGAWNAFQAIAGTTEEDPTSLTEARKNQLTIHAAYAPKSDGAHWEAAANYGRLFAVNNQNNPHLDIKGSLLPDMPTPTDIGKSAIADERDVLVKKGLSTVELSAGSYKIVDFVSTYHPEDESLPQWRFARVLVIDMNVRFSVLLRERQNVLDHAIAADEDVVVQPRVMKPKYWKSVLADLAVQLSRRALIADPDFMIESIEVGIDPTNPDRINAEFRYKRTGFVRISSTVATAGFNFGTL